MRLCDFALLRLWNKAQQFVNKKMRYRDSALLLIYLNISKLSSWFAGLLVCWFAGLLVCWFAGLL